MNCSCHTIIVTAIGLIGPSLTYAHHSSSAAFDMDREVTIDGVIQRYEWKNPHLYFYVGTVNDAGSAVEWRVEAGPLAIMRRLGWSRDSLAPGDHVVLSANPSRRPDRLSAFLKTIETDAGPLLSFQGKQTRDALQASEAPPGEHASGFSGTWATLLNLESVGWVDDPSKLALTPAGKASVAGFDETTMHPALDCIPFTAPVFMLIPDTKSIEAGGNEIRIRGEFDATERIVYLGPVMHRPDGPLLHGYSAGFQVGNKLRIVTSDFAEHRTGIAFGLTSSLQKHLVEELETNAGGTSLTYRFALEDPAYLAEPVTGSVQWEFRPDIEFEYSECDIANSRIFLTD